MKSKPVIAILFLILLVANLVLFVLEVLSALIFWGVLMVIGIYAFKFLPEKTRSKKK